MQTKWFARSRALWAGLIPLLVVALPMLGVDPVGLEEQLVALGEQAELTVQSLLLLVSAGLAFWHKLRPDGKKNTVLPTLPKGAAAWLWIFLLAPSWLLLTARAVWRA